MMKTKRLISVIALLVASGVVACGGSADAPERMQAARPAEEAPAQAGAQATGTVSPTPLIEVQMITDGEGNSFKPSRIDARPGDVLRFVLVSGVHNVSWPAELNAAGAKLPAPSELLQLPGQTYELPLDLPPGEYVFQCDPHAAVGMVGTLNISK